MIKIYNKFQNSHFNKNWVFNFFFGHYCLFLHWSNYISTKKRKVKALMSITTGIKSICLIKSYSFSEELLLCPEEVACAEEPKYLVSTSIPSISPSSCFVSYKDTFLNDSSKTSSACAVTHKGSFSKYSSKTSSSRFSLLNTSLKYSPLSS